MVVPCVDARGEAAFADGASDAERRIGQLLLGFEDSVVGRHALPGLRSRRKTALSSHRRGGRRCRETAERQADRPCLIDVRTEIPVSPV